MSRSETFGMALVYQLPQGVCRLQMPDMKLQDNKEGCRNRFFQEKI